MSNALEDDHPLWLVNEQLKGLLEGGGACEDHEAVLSFLHSTGLPRDTVDRLHTAITFGDIKASRFLAGQETSALDTQEGGDHYKKLGHYQPWEVLAQWMTPEELRGYAKGTAIAYLARERDKGGRLDTKKALHTLQLYMELSGKGESDEH
jgi:hypothetical protein